MSFSGGNMEQLLRFWAGKVVLSDNWLSDALTLNSAFFLKWRFWAKNGENFAEKLSLGSQRPKMNVSPYGLSNL